MVTYHNYTQKNNGLLMDTRGWEGAVCQVAACLTGPQLLHN